MSEKTRKAPAPKIINPNKTENCFLKFNDDTDDALYEVLSDGIYRTEKGSANRKKLCSAVQIKAGTTNVKGNEWSLWLCIKDIRGKLHNVVLPKALCTKPKAIEEILLSCGLRVYSLSGNSNKGTLAACFNSVPLDLLPYALSVDHGGFATEDFNSFVFGGGEENILKLDGAELVAPIDEDVAAPLVLKGSLEGWQREVASKAKYSIRMMFALCVGLSAPLLPIVDGASTIFHFYCTSSKGKSTILNAAASIYGGKIYGWHGTVNGLEGLTKMHNNQLLILDEIGQADTNEIEYVYALTDAKEKVRSTANGKLRKGSSWREPILSSGEFSISEIREQKAKVTIGVASGEIARFIAIPAEAENGLGVLDSLPPCSSPKDEKKSNTERAADFIKSLYLIQNTGHAGREFVLSLMKDYAKEGKERFVNRLKETAEIIKDKLKEDSELSQETLEHRVIDRFAIVAMAGELATEYGILGDEWKQGDATNAVIECFKVWRHSDDSPEGRQNRVVGQFLELPNSDGSSYLIYEWEGGNNFRFISRPNHKTIGTIVLDAKRNKDRQNMAARIAMLYHARQFNDLAKDLGERMRIEEVLDALNSAGVLFSNMQNQKRRPQYQITGKGFCDIPDRGRVYVILPNASPASRDLADRMLKQE